MCGQVNEIGVGQLFHTHLFFDIPVRAFERFSPLGGCQPAPLEAASRLSPFRRTNLAWSNGPRKLLLMGFSSPETLFLIRLGLLTRSCSLRRKPFFVPRPIQLSSRAATTDRRGEVMTGKRQKTSRLSSTQITVSSLSS